MNPPESVLAAQQGPSLVLAPCPVCAHTLAAPFFAGGKQTLATLGWPRSAAEALTMPRYAQNFVQCPNCSHVWNRTFSYDAIPYQSNPNRMFNSGGIWTGHLAVSRNKLREHLPATPTVVEVGCGEGHFLRGLAHSLSEDGRFIGFDPNASPETGQGVEFQPRLFDPIADIGLYRPDAIIIRHVLEHLTEPAALLEQMAWGAANLDKPCWLFAEVPCIDRVLETNRLADFFYEHVSHFTTESFRTLIARAGEVSTLEHGYEGEVVYALARLAVPFARHERAVKAQAFARRATGSRIVIRAQLDALAKSASQVAIWGGTGKAAAFIHQFGADAERFPCVVDSDPDKCGTFVPGTGQRIVYRDTLKTQPAGVVIIPSQWRARDIVAEMTREGIPYAQVLIEHDGRLVDFFLDEHPYRLDEDEGG